jgi:hypothetical protein
METEQSGKPILSRPDAISLSSVFLRVLIHPMSLNARRGDANHNPFKCKAEHRNQDSKSVRSAESCNPLRRVLAFLIRPISNFPRIFVIVALKKQRKMSVLQQGYLIVLQRKFHFEIGISQFDLNILQYLLSYSSTIARGQLNPLLFEPQ